MWLYAYFTRITLQEGMTKNLSMFIAIAPHTYRANSLTE